MCAILSAPTALSAQSIEQASPTADIGTSLEEVIVTARRRAENLQTVPVAVSPFSSADLREDNITSTQDLVRFVPSLTINNTVGFGAGFVLRGQGTIVGAPPSVVAYFADVPLINAQTALGLSQGGIGTGQFFDVTSVDVLKGPQGTLFGRNTTGGAILITPEKPTNTLEGYGQITLGEYDWREFEGAVNVPVIDDVLLVRVATDVSVRDGYTQDVGPFFPGRDYDNRNYRAMRLSVLYKPSQRLENQLILDGNYKDQHGQGGKIIAANPDGLAVGAFPAIFSFIAAQQALGPRYTSLSGDQIDRESRFAAIDSARWALSDLLTLKNIAAYQSEKNTVGVLDFDSTSFPIQDVSTPKRWAGTGEQYSEELQLIGSLRTDRLQWVAGGYLEYARPTDMPEVDVAQPAEVVPGTYLPVKVVAQGATTERSHAAYGQLSYRLGDLLRQLDHLKFTGGFRYTWDYAAQSSSVFIPAFQNLCAFTLGVAPNCIVSPSGHFNAPSWTLGLDYQVTPRTLAYITARRGYKSGGFNLQTPFHSLYSTFLPEHVTDVELGVKADWEFAGINARTNVDVFHADYNDLQRVIPVAVNEVIASVVENAASATIEGIEWEQTLRPGARTELRLSYSYLQSKYNHYFSPVLGDLSGQPFAYTPRNKASVSARYELPLSEQLGSVSASMAYSYQSTMSGEQSGPYEEIAWVGLLNGRLDWSGLFRSGLEVSVFVTNATNKLYVTRLSESYSSSGTAIVSYGEPRIVGGQFRYRFGP
jgi:iron complex outermembrane receptor protein